MSTPKSAVYNLQKLKFILYLQNVKKSFKFYCKVDFNFSFEGSKGKQPAINCLRCVKVLINSLHLTSKCDS